MSTFQQNRRSLGLASAALLATLLPACGFKLRGSPNLPFQTMYVSFAETSSLGQELRRSLESTGVRVITDSRQLGEAQAVLDVLQDVREKVVVGVNTSGLVREFQLRVRFKFRLRDKAGNDLIAETELLQQRDFSFNESGALAKEAEEALIYRGMQSDIVQQALRRLAAVKTLP
jgi:LPS-assembly lipoprotein